MNIIESELKSNPGLQVLSLEFSQITNLAPFVQKLAQFKNLREVKNSIFHYTKLSLHGNRLSTLPEDLSSLRNLEQLDISNNLIQNVVSIIPALRSLPNLRNLTINTRGTEDAEQLVSALPNLEYLNETPVNSNQPEFNRQNDSVQSKGSPQAYSKGQADDIGIKQEDLEAVGVLYDCIRELFKELKPEKDKVLAEEFDEHVKNVMYDLSSKLSTKSNAVVQSTHILKAKFALYEICFGKIIQLIGGIDPRLSSVLEGIHDAHAVIFKELTGIVARNSDLGVSKKGEAQESQLLEAAESLEKENQKLKYEREQLLKELENDRNEFMEQITSLQEENSKYLEQIIKHSKDNADHNLGKLSESVNYQKTDSDKRRRDKPQPAATYESFAGNAYTQKNSSVYAGQGNTYIGQTAVRALTLKQIKDVIEEIYVSKTKYDQRCAEAKLPRETMEQHMYTYLNQKYGLKNLIIEWATAIINAIKKFSSEDNDVAVFGKILRNECDEEFRFVQSQVKETISELLKMYLRSKHPLKTNTEIKEMLQHKIAGSILEEECNDIINYMYNQDDAEFLLSKLRKFYTFPGKASLDSNKRLPRDQQLKLMNEKEKPIIEYNIFQKVILDFQLKSHEKFLKNFVACFRLVDKDLNGIIDEAEFREMINYFESHGVNPDPEKLLATVDPYNHQQITFSQCVSLFSSETINDGEHNLSILQKLSLDS